MEGLETAPALALREVVIRDLLWGCVVCGKMESIREVDRTETCENCGAKYRRARGAQISVEVEGKGIETRTAA